MKIEKLTQKQIDRLPEKVDEWCVLGLSTEPLDKEKIEQFVELAYQAGGLQAPAIQYVSGPMEGLKLTKELTGKIDYNYFSGQFAAGWLSFYDTFSEFGLETEIAPLHGLLGLAKSCGWVWFYDTLCIVTEHPNQLNRDAQGRLHNLNGPAISFNDGFKIYAINGVVVPEPIILSPTTITVTQIQKEGNSEIRRVMMEQYGIEKFLKDSGAVLRNQDQYGKLYDIPNDRAISLCEVINSTAERDGHKKVYYLTVPQRVRCAHEAVAGTFGMTMETYHPSAQS